MNLLFRPLPAGMPRDGFACGDRALDAWSNLPLKKAECEAAAQRRPAQSERKDRVFSAKRQTAWFE